MQKYAKPRVCDVSMKEECFNERTSLEVCIIFYHAHWKDLGMEIFI